MRRLLAAAIAVTGLSTSMAMPSYADSGSTPTQVTVNAGVLSITVPSATASGASSFSAVSQTVTLSLGNTSVSDGRGTGAAWRVDATMAAAMTTGGITPSTIPLANVHVYSGATTVNTGNTSVTTTTSPGVAMNTGGTIINGTSVAATPSTVTYNPTVVVTIPAAQPVGTYTGSVTQTTF